MSLQERQCNISARFTALSLVTMTMEIVGVDSDIIQTPDCHCLVDINGKVSLEIMVSWSIVFWSHIITFTKEVM